MTPYFLPQKASTSARSWAPRPSFHANGSPESVLGSPGIGAHVPSETDGQRRWIERIAANNACDLWRRRRQRPELIVGSVEEAVPSLEASDQLATDLAHSVPPEHLLAALAELDSSQREAVVLRHLLHYEPEEIAAMVGASGGAVRVRTHRGLNELRRILEATEREEPNERAG